MKQVLVLIFLVPLLCLKAQKYRLNVQAEPQEDADYSSFLVITTEGQNFFLAQVLPNKQVFVLDTSLTYPHPIEVRYYIDCNEKEIEDLQKFGEPKSRMPV